MSTTITSAGSVTANKAKSGIRCLIQDKNPAKNGNLLFIATDGNETGNGATPNLGIMNFFVSSDNGSTWTQINITEPSDSFNGGVSNPAQPQAIVQDTTNYKFHLLVLDNIYSDRYYRLIPSYDVSGNITGLSVDVVIGIGDQTINAQSSRTMAISNDGSGTDVIFVWAIENVGGTGPLPSARVCKTKSSVGVSPTVQTDFLQLDDSTSIGSTGASMQAADAPSTSSETDDRTSHVAVGTIKGNGTAKGTVVGLMGRPMDKKLDYVLMTPAASAHTYSIGSVVNVSANIQQDSSNGLSGTLFYMGLSLFEAPDGSVWYCYVENSTSANPGIHINKFDTNGTHTVDAVPQPSTSTAVVKPVIQVDPSGTVGVMYGDGSGHILSRFYKSGAWDGPTTVDTLSAANAAWNSSTTILRSGTNYLAYARDVGSGAATTLSLAAFPASNATWAINTGPNSFIAGPGFQDPPASEWLPTYPDFARATTPQPVNNLTGYSFLNWQPFACVDGGQIPWLPTYPDFARTAPSATNNLTGSAFVDWQPFVVASFDPAKMSWLPVFPDFAKGTPPMLVADQQALAMFAFPLPIWLRSFSTAKSTTGLTLTINKPAGTIQNDVLIVTIFAGSPNNTSQPAITPPSGWTQIVKTDHGTIGTLVSYYLVAGASEPSSYSWTFTATPDGNPVLEGIMECYVGVNTSSPIVTSSGQDNTSSGNSYSTPSITISLDAMLISAWGGTQ